MLLNFFVLSCFCSILPNYLLNYFRWGVEVSQYKNEDNQNKLNDLVERIKNVYLKIRSSVKEFSQTDRVSDTLITLQLVDFYSKYYNEFEKARSTMNIDNIKYPQMKVLDSCFWQVGFDLDNTDGSKKSH